VIGELGLVTAPLVSEGGGGAPGRAPPRGQVHRLGRNITWLLGSRGLSGALSVAYLGVASRALGPAGFGAFVLILAYAGAVAGLAQFKSWQAVVRFGALHRGVGRQDRVDRLLGLTGSIDLAAAAAGAVLAVGGAAAAGPAFGWTDGQTRAAGLFAAALLLTTGDTASGAMRLDGRFALLTLSETVASLTRLCGAAAVWSTGGGLASMLVVWALAAAAESGLEWAFVLGGRRARPALGVRNWRLAAAENAGIWRFMLDCSASSSLAMLWQQAGTLAVGASAGDVAAGGFRIAGKLAGALAKPAEAATRALLPQLAAFVAGGDPSPVRRLIVRGSAVGACLGLVLVVAIATVGAGLLRLVAGPAFAGAEPFLLILSAAAAVDLCSVVLEPVLAAHGRTRDVVVARIVGGIAYGALLAVLLPRLGPIGAAVAALAGTVALRVVQTIAVRRLLASAALSIRSR
jgi:O-antigen/teichoic acid export membrane protein